MNEVLRKERKYLINLEQMYRDTHVLSQILHEDKHNCGSGYMIRSLYFDTPDDRDFHEKEDGIELRRKMRLRCYSPDADFAVLEMKQKQGDSQRKRSLRMSRTDAQRLIRGEYSVCRALCCGMFCDAADARLSSQIGRRISQEGVYRERKQNPYHV